MKNLKTISAVIAIVICNASVQAQVEDYTNVISRTIILKPNSVSPSVYKNNETFEFDLQSTTPLPNMYGEDSTIVLVDGTVSFVFPPNGHEVYTYSDITQIKIEEKGMYDKHKKVFVFKAEQVQFSIHDGERTVCIQLDLNELPKNSKKLTYDLENLLSIRKFYGSSCCN